MAQRTVRYALVDLTNRTAEIQEIQADHFGTWAMHVDEMAFWWESDPTTVAFTTGVLTGVGAPGTGAMSWSYPVRNGRLQTVPSEGRLGAMMRCAGVDAMVLYGRSEQKLCLTVADDGISMEEKSVSYADLLANKKHEDAVLVTVSRKAVVEDQYFAIGDSTAAKALLNKGVGAIVVETEGAFQVADSTRLTERSVAMYQSAIRSGTLAQRDGRKNPVYYLSLDHSVTFGEEVSFEKEVESEKEKLLAALGIIWSESLAGRDPMEDAAALVSAVLGVPCTAAELEELGAYLAACEKKKVAGGAI